MPSRLPQLADVIEDEAFLIGFDNVDDTIGFSSAEELATMTETSTGFGLTHNRSVEFPMWGKKSDPRVYECVIST